MILSVIEINNNDTSLDLIGFILILVGILSATFPYAAWYLEIGWKLHDTEPSEFALIANRVIGVFISIVGLFILI
ncbi:hypothetical protein E3U55_10390 [Filobacillus milosensis]|uniref:DUF6199 domain-containing protein n=1 Tax=Filobacillus milosensis TaxID=94137 RepID=A0A4Y8IGB2_9BACI|nr:DUF6199 family natural product biosynthesis protein [Filobacillus milosensis]TFB19561.1 hypothetical protein E3U55_10390 [Filobacillus milosensis]